MKYFKVVLIGDSSSGKTCLLNLFFDKPNPLQTQINGLSYYQHQIRINEIEKCEFNIWDTPGQEKFIPIILLCLKTNDPLIVIICYDMHYEDGGEHIQYFIDQVKSKNENAKIVILGTKQNLGENENQKNIEKKFSNYRFYKVGLNGKEILNQIFHSFYEEIIAQQTLIQQELQIVQDKKLIQNKQEQSLIKKPKKKSFWRLFSYENDD